MKKERGTDQGKIGKGERKDNNENIEIESFFFLEENLRIPIEKRRNLPKRREVEK